MDVLRHWCIGLHSLFHMQLTHWSIDVVLHSHVLIVLQPLLHEFKVWVAYFPEFRSHWCIDALVHWFAPSVYGSIVPCFNCRLVASNPCFINPQHHRFNWMMFQRFSVHSCNCFMRPWGMLVACSSVPMHWCANHGPINAMIHSIAVLILCAVVPLTQWFHWLMDAPRRWFMYVCFIVSVDSRA